jgi:hypothetical protein
MAEESKTPASAETTAPETEAYEAPRIETVVTREELEREVHYAGNITVVG